MKPFAAKNNILDSSKDIFSDSDSIGKELVRDPGCLDIHQMIQEEVSTMGVPTVLYVKTLFIVEEAGFCKRDYSHQIFEQSYIA